MERPRSYATTGQISRDLEFKSEVFDLGRRTFRIRTREGLSRPGIVHPIGSPFYVYIQTDHTQRVCIGLRDGVAAPTDWFRDLWSRCNCPDFAVGEIDSEPKDHVCKHIVAVWGTLVEDREMAEEFLKQRVNKGSPGLAGAKSDDGDNVCSNESPSVLGPIEAGPIGFLETDSFSEKASISRFGAISGLNLIVL